MTIMSAHIKAALKFEAKTAHRILTEYGPCKREYYLTKRGRLITSNRWGAEEVGTFTHQVSLRDFTDAVLAAWEAQNGNVYP